MIKSPSYEEKRSRLWNKTVWISSILIICTVLFFAVRLFTQNPIIGRWMSEGGECALDMQRKGTVEARYYAPDKEEPVTLKSTYHIEKDERIVTFNMTEDDITEAVTACGEADLAEQAEQYFIRLSTGFNYSIDKNVMTLTEREYGSQLIFIKE